MRYLDAKTGTLYYVDVIGVGKKGPNYGAYRQKINEPSPEEIIEIVPCDKKTEAEEKLADYAKQHGIDVELIGRVKREERVLQGNKISTNDFQKLTAEEVVEEAKQYFEAETKIDLIKAKHKEEVAALKAALDEEVQEQLDIMESLKSVVTVGLKKVECEASWERDINNGVMLLVRHDTMTVLQARTMTAEEIQINTSDVEAQG